MVLFFIARPAVGVNSMNSYEILGFCNKEDCMNTPKINEVAEHDGLICIVSLLYGVNFVLPQNIPYTGEGILVIHIISPCAN